MDANDGAEQPWHHGQLQRIEAVKLLKTNGDFLVRTSVKANKVQAVISVMWNNTTQHVVVYKTFTNKITLYPDGPTAANCFDSLVSLINYYLTSKKPLPNVEYVLMRALSKEPSGQSDPAASKFKSRGKPQSLLPRTKVGGTGSGGTPQNRSRMIECAPAKVEDEDWYHGLMPREDINKMLQKQGDFIVGYTEVAGAKRFVISICWNSQVHHVVLHKMDDGKFTVDPRNPKDQFTSISSLVRHFYGRQEPVAQWGYVLMHPIPRQAWELRHEKIVLGKKLGAEQILELVSESRVMQTLSHTNIVNLIGIAAEQQPLMIIIELVSGGSLDEYLRANTFNVTIPQRMNFCAGASAGLAYLHGMKVLHRDIASRNCLITDDESVKISDFGLATEGTSFKQTKNTKLPIRWLSPETLKSGGTFSLTSDVWSFGILCWEIFHNAIDPYPGMKVIEVAQMIKGGGSMNIADDGMIPDKVKPTILSCWRADPDTRPDMKALAIELDGLRK